MLELTLRERGSPIAIAPADWLRLQMEHSIGALHRRGILRVERTTAAIMLFPSTFVGELRAPGLTLTIRAKDELFYKAMLGLAENFDARTAQHHEARSNTAVGDDLASPYVRALSACVEEGLPWQYERQVEATSRPRGKPQFTQTISSFLSRGVFHKIVAAHHDRQQLHSFASVVWAAYRCLPNAPGLTNGLAQRAARLVEAIDNDRELDVAEALWIGAELLEEETISNAGRRLLTASLLLLDRTERSGTSLISIPAGKAQFVNLERIWERAVASLLRTWVSDNENVALHGLSADNIHLFGERGPVIDPDVVVFDKGRSATIVADAKYKILAPTEARGLSTDIYQLTCYIERIRPPVGVLVYVGTTDSVTQLGLTVSGLRVLVVRVSPGRLLSDGDQALSHLLNAAPDTVEMV